MWPGGARPGTLVPMKRRLKQFAYLLLFVAFWGGIGWLGYVSLIAQPASCFDNKQNQGEEGVDCGGPCKTFCIAKDLIPPAELGEPRVFQPSSDLVAVLVELKNPNATAALRQVPYQVEVSGVGAAPLQLKGVASLYANEVRRFVLVRPSSGLGAPLSARIAVATTSAQWAPAEQFRKPLIDIVNAVTSSTESGTRVEGTISSDDALAVTDVTVVALFYDAAGSLLGASQTVLPRLEPGGTTRFAISYPALAGLDPEATQVSVSAYRP